MNQDWSQSLPADDASGELIPPPSARPAVQADPAQKDRSTQAETTLIQIQHRLFNLATQIDHIQSQVDNLVMDTQISGEHVMTLTRHLTDVQGLQTVNERLAELLTQITAHQSQLETVTQTITQTANREQVERLTQMLGTVANQEQLQRLTQLVANQEQVTQLEDALKKLMRTQFKANTLGESKEQQITSALAILQELATQREKAQFNQTARDPQPVVAAHPDGRAELAAELLPALDSLELALENGAALLERQRAQVHTIMRDQANYLTELADYAAAQRQAPVQPPVGFWQRLFTNAPEPLALPIKPPPATAPLTHIQAVFNSTAEATEAWLQGLELVRERFTALLAGEGIQPIEALNKLFDPRLHVAVEAEPRSDVPPNTIVRVLRKGYRQQNRILRYAEVVVARAVTA